MPLRCLYPKSLQSCPTLCNPMDCSFTGSFVHGILQARILEWVGMPSSKGSSNTEIEPMSLATPAWPAVSLLKSHGWHPLWLLHPFLKQFPFGKYFYNSNRNMVQFSSVQFSLSVVSDSLRPHELQHTRLPCPSPTPGVHSNSCPSIQWCHPAISFSVIPFSSCLQSLPASESFPMSQLFTWCGQVLEFQL